MLNAVQLGLLPSLLRCAADDLGRSYSATWSTDRLRTLLMQVCLHAGHQVSGSVVVGTPVHQDVRGVRSQRSQRSQAVRPANLQITLHNDGSLVLVDLLTAGTASDNAGALSPQTARTAIDRVMAGTVDALLIAADAALYDRLHDSAARAKASAGFGLVQSVLPRSTALAQKKAHLATLGDATVTTSGGMVVAFGVPRVACMVHMLPY